MRYQGSIMHDSSKYNNDKKNYNNQKLLTIAIPTRNRHEFLQENLSSLNSQIKGFESVVEIIVCDNSDDDLSKKIVDKYNALNLNIIYKKNIKDIGSDRNIAQSFNMAQGKYVHIIGDDDIYYINTLSKLIEKITTGEYGSIFLRPYGFESNYLKEYPSIKIGRNKVFGRDDFLLKIATQITLLSAHVINKSLIKNINANDYCGTNLVQVNLLLDAVTKTNKNYYFNEYLLAYKKNNSGGYNLFDIFINKFGLILDDYVEKKLLSQNLKEKIECKKIKYFFPLYLFRHKYCLNKNLKEVQIYFTRLKKYNCYKYFIRPIFKLPNALSWSWCVALIIYGRLLNGDVALGATYLKSIIRKKIFFN